MRIAFLTNNAFLVEVQPSRTWKGIGGEKYVYLAMDITMDGAGFPDPSDFPKIDKWYFYLPLGEGHILLSTIRRLGIPPKNIVFVMCDCEEARKRSSLDKEGFADSLRLLTHQCGGRDVLSALYFRECQG